MFKGTLIPIGGNEDKGVSEEITEFVKDGILSHVVKESGGRGVQFLSYTYCFNDSKPSWKKITRRL